MSHHHHHHNVEGYHWSKYSYEDSTGRKEFEEHFRDLNHPERNFDKVEHIPGKGELGAGLQEEPKRISNQPSSNVGQASIQSSSSQAQNLSSQGSTQQGNMSQSSDQTYNQPGFQHSTTYQGQSATEHFPGSSSNQPQSTYSQHYTTTDQPHSTISKPPTNVNTQYTTTSGNVNQPSQFSKEQSQIPSETSIYATK